MSLMEMVYLYIACLFVLKIFFTYSVNKFFLVFCFYSGFVFVFFVELVLYCSSACLRTNFITKYT